MKITFIGDSIRSQYVPRVAELLGEGFEIFTPQENCRFAQYTLRGLFDWAENMKGSRIVHFNCGLWDICNLFGDGLFTSEEEYVACMLRIADILLSRYECVVFATTTPVREENIYDRTADVIRYNEILVPRLRERGVRINDLFSTVAADIGGNVSDDFIHLTDRGIELCAAQTADVIRTLAAELSQTAARETEDTALAEGAPVLIMEEH